MVRTEVRNIIRRSSVPFSKLTSKGQTTIPKSIRDALKLKPGDRIEFTIIGDNRVQLSAKNKSIADLAGILYDPDREPVSIEEMNDAIGQAAVEKYLKSE